MSELLCGLQVTPASALNSKTPIFSTVVQLAAGNLMKVDLRSGGKLLKQ